MVPGPVVPVYGPEDGRSVYAADSQVLLARLRAGTPLTDCPAEAAGVRSLWRPQALAPAFRPFDSAAALAAAMPDARELILRRLAENGVTVVDPAATYVDPRCSVPRASPCCRGPSCGDTPPWTGTARSVPTPCSGTAGSASAPP